MLNASINSQAPSRVDHHQGLWVLDGVDDARAPALIIHVMTNEFGNFQQQSFMIDIKGNDLQGIVDLRELWH